MGFPIKYLFNLIWHGYWNNPAEVEARNRAARLILDYSHDDPCHCSTPRTHVTAPPEIVEVITGTPPTTEPRELTPGEVTACCQSGQDNLSIKWQATKTWRDTGSDIHIKVWAQSKCGVRQLRTDLLLVQSVGTEMLYVDVDRADQKDGCKEYVLKEYERFVVPPASLMLKAEATSCCGKKVTGTALIGA